MSKTYQINNLTIAYNTFYRKWQLKTPGGVVVEEFKLLEDAKNWAEKTHDFIQK